MFKKIFLSLALLSIFLPNVALAVNGEILPEYNPLCWKKKACNAQRAAIRNINEDQLKKDYGEGWFKNEAPCVGGKPGEEWGKCLPVGVITTQVAFAGRTQFLHIGDFIHTIYKYAVAIAGIVATFMLIIAGFQWVTSAGNSESISSAKKRITGAVTGLLIAYLSFVILNSLNPALVNLRLPQVWMVRPQSIVPQFCSTAAAAKDSAVFGYSGKDANDQTSKLDLAKLAPNYDLTYSGQPVAPKEDPNLNKNYKGAETGQASFYCGNRFFIKDGGASACFGDVCGVINGKLNVCVDYNYNGKPSAKKYWCKEGMLTGIITGSVGGLSRKVLNNGVFQDGMRLIAMCKDGSINEISTIDAEKSEVPQEYTFPVPGKSIEDNCGGKANILGFYIGVAGHDQTGCTGLAIEGLSGSCGLDDWYAVGQDKPGSHLCNVNLAKQELFALGAKSCGAGNLGCTCQFLSEKRALAVLLANSQLKSQITQHLITLDELKNGYQCNIDMSRSEFPAADNEGDFLWDEVKTASCNMSNVIATIPVGGTPSTLLCAQSVTYGKAASAIIGAVNIGNIADPTKCLNWQ